MTESKSQNTIYFQHLDLIRFLAAFMIVILHAYEGWKGWFGEVGFLSNGTFTTLSPVGSYVDQFIKNLGIGVDVFFLISGFLITYLLLEEKKQNSKINIGFFMIRRSLRIWPLYFLLVALAPLIVKWTASGHPNYLANALFVGNFEMIQSQSWTYPFAHFWSICIEEHFYLFWPFVIAFTPIKKLLYVFGGIVLVSVGYRLYTFYYLDAKWFNLFLNTLSRIDVLVIGAIGAYFYSKNKIEFSLRPIIRIVLWIILISYLCWDSFVLWDSALTAGFKKYFYLAIVSILLLDFNFNQRYKHWLPAKSIVHYFGKISYGIYMFSNIIQLIVIKNIMWPMAWGNMWVYFGLVIGLSLVIPIISYELVEKPILKLSKRFRVVKTDR